MNHRLLLREAAIGNPLRYQRVIGSHPAKNSVAEQVHAAVADVPDLSQPAFRDTCHRDRGTHPGQGRVVFPGRSYSLVGFDDPGFEGGHTFFGHRLDGDSAGYFSACMAAHTIGHD
jgi:hypothetical protein